MSSTPSLSERIARLRQLQVENPFIAPTAAAPLPGDWPVGTQAYPASLSQARLWLLHQVEPDLTAYHLPAAWILRGNLDLYALNQALSSLIKRHATLRTSFLLHDSDVVQLIHQVVAFHLVPEALSPINPDQVLKQWLDHERATPFDLSAGLLIRARLLSLSLHEHLLLINHHHIASDHWSRRVLARDLVALYNSHHLGQPPQSPPLTIQYPDYAVWQRQQLNESRLRQLRGYWVPQLSGLDPLALPSDYPRPASQSYEGSTVRFDIKPELLAPFAALCSRHGATQQMGFMALLAVILHRYSRQDDVVVGVPTWGRNHPELEQLVGFFINTLPIRIHLDPAQCFGQLLEQIKATSLAAYDHQDFPFEQMVEALKLPRDPSRHPLFQVILQLIEPSENSLEGLLELEVQAVVIQEETSRFDLEIVLTHASDGGIKGEITFPMVLFSRHRIERLCEHILVLLDAVPGSVDLPLSALPLLTQREASRLAQWQDGPSMHRCESSVPALFNTQVARDPAAFAVIYQDQQLTYGQLAEESDHLAHYLVKSGVREDSLVALCLERSSDQIVALLAILKSGAAYLSLDPSWPLERQELLLKEVHCSFLLTSGLLTDAFATAHTYPYAATTVCDGFELRSLDELATAQSAPAHFDWPEPSPDALAYVCFTSGSTGIPKGVAIEHRSIVRLIDPVNGFNLGPGSITLYHSPLPFDASTFEIWGPLLNGGALVVAPPGILSLSELESLVYTKGITTIWLAAGLFHAMVDSKLAALSRVKQVLAGGDVLSAKSVKALLNAFPPGHELINGYGPTEATTFASCHRMDASTWVDHWHVPIGRPVAATHVCVLDSAGQTCPIGIPGELHVGGIGLAREYLSNPDLTAARFVADPRSDQTPMRLYKTGDVVSWNANGTLAFHERVDNQVKLRGFRIELGEIEAYLASHPAVEGGKIVLHKDSHGGSRLVCYWVFKKIMAKEYPSLAADDLRAFLAANLPSHMIPSQFIRLESIPLTPNGKPDLKSLPAPQFTTSEDALLSTATDLEVKLMQIWSGILAHSGFARSDSFFLVGGDSLMAVRLVAAIEEQFGVPLSVLAIFRWPTITEQAACLSLRLSAQPNQEEPGHSLGDQCLVPLQRHGSLPPLFGIHGWGGRVGMFYSLARGFGDRRPVYGLQAPEQSIDLTGSRLVDYAALYADLIWRHHGSSMLHLIGHSAGGWYAYAVAHALRAKGVTIGCLLLSDTGPIDRSVRRLDLYADLTRSYVPVPLDVPLYLLCVKGKRQRMESFWQAYARAGLTVLPVFDSHHDFGRPDRQDDNFRLVSQLLSEAEGTP